jgi:NDP-sugar pyrophosphorylase family protein
MTKISRIPASIIGNDNVCLVLGDNIFYGQSFTQTLKQAAAKTHGATVFGYQVKDPERFGVVEFDENFNAQANIVVADKFFADDKCLCQAVRTGLHGIADGNTEIAAVAEQAFERGVLPHHARRIQTAAARVRQAHDLLSPVRLSWVFS